MSKSLTNQDAEIQIAKLKEAVDVVRFQLSKEREKGKPNKNQLQTQIAAKQDEIEKIQSQIEKAKSHAKRRKREIDDWKQWFHTFPGPDRTEEQAKLNVEINWRGAEINVRQDEIGRLETQKWAIRGELEALQQQLFALNEGVYERPIEEDPRLIHAIAACEEGIATLKTALTDR